MKGDTMTYYIGSARHDENGKYAGGKKGDQTGNEVTTQPMYNHRKGWVCYRFLNPYHAVALKRAMLTACSNKHIGYSQSDRYGVIRSGIDTKKDCNADCSSLVRACIINACGTDVGDFTTASEGQALESSKLFRKVGRVTKRSKLYEGDLLVTASKGHTAIVTTGLSRMDEVVESPKSQIALTRAHGLSYAKTFCGDITDSDLANDKIKVRTKVLQHALNLDYGAGLKEDGIYGPKTEKALGSHYVKYGEKQYMVSCAEILCYLLGSNPNGFECPGIYGKGLRQATGKSKLDSSWFKKKVI